MNYGVCPGDHFAIIDLDLGESKNGIEAFSSLECGEDLDDWITDETFTVFFFAAAVFLATFFFCALRSEATFLVVGIKHSIQRYTIL